VTDAPNRPPTGVRALARQRQEVILADLRRNGSVRVAELAHRLGVSDMTVRRDLDALDESGALTKVHGGATIRDQHSTDEPGFEAKSLRNTGEKHAIAMAAAGMVKRGAAIGITAGTTTWQLAFHMVDVPDLTVVTNSVRVADVFHHSPRSDRVVVLTGGLRTPSDALVGPVATAALRTMHLDLVFMGVHGMSERAGFTTPNLMESETNRAFVATGDRLVVLTDHTKWNVQGLSTIADLDEADVLITDSGLTPTARATLATHVRQLLTVDPVYSNRTTDLTQLRRA
jgi:DeoR/GlpR family transcriptional regulator of sugar metabolism